MEQEIEPINIEKVKLENFTKLLYTKYCEYVGGKAFNGDKLPDWETFSSNPKKQVQVTAWRNIAMNAVKCVKVIWKD